MGWATDSAEPAKFAKLTTPGAQHIHRELI